MAHTKIKTGLRKIPNPLFLGVVLAAVLIAAGCSSSGPAGSQSLEADPVQPDAPAAGNQPTGSPTSNPEQGMEVDHCLDCHTDQERLVAVANPVEVVESESSGEG